MRKKTISEIDVAGRRVLMRVDFNVPIRDGEITDDRRMTMALESIRSVTERGGALILMSHLGRPKGERSASKTTGPRGQPPAGVATGETPVPQADSAPLRPDLSLRPVSERLGSLLGQTVLFADDCVGDAADRAAAALEPGNVLVLENLRFHDAETLIDRAKKNPDRRPYASQRAEITAFAEALARHADVYCNNAFGTCHRKHVSMYDVPRRLGSGRRVCGHLVERELRFLGQALASPRRPFLAILGGAKVSDKIGVISNLLPKVDGLLIGGAMAYTFLAAQGADVGASLCERDMLELARRLLKDGAGKIHLPEDSVCADTLEAGGQTVLCGGAIRHPLKGLDIGPRTAERFASFIRDAKTLVWNGPMGVFETAPFDAGTIAVGRAVAAATDGGATSIIGGGDSAAAVEAAGLSQRMTHISTGGGASLEFLEGKRFETIEILDDAE